MLVLAQMLVEILIQKPKHMPFFLDLHRYYWHPFCDSRNELNHNPWSLQNSIRQNEHDVVAVADVLLKSAKIRQIVRIKKYGNFEGNCLEGRVYCNELL